MSTPSQDQRKADTLMQQSQKSLSGVKLVLNKQVAIWKAMFVALFVAGFCAAIAWVASISVTAPQDAVSQDPQEAEQLSYQGYEDRRYDRQPFPTPPDRSRRGEGSEYGGEQMVVEDESLIVSTDNQDGERNEESLINEEDLFKVDFSETEAAPMPQKPELGVYNYSFQGWYDAGYGMHYLFHFYIKNNGSVAAGTSLSLFKTDKGANGSYEYSMMSQSGSVQPYGGTTGGMGGGIVLDYGATYNVVACADSDKEVAEINENNNCTSPMRVVVPNKT